MRLLRLLLPMAASLLAAQGPKPALDVLPEKSLGFLLFRDPVLSQVKLQGLLQRTGAKGALSQDPLSGAQKAFALPQLPAGRQGMAIVYLEDGAAAGESAPREVLYLSPPDPAAFLAKLHAAPKEKGLFAYKAGGRTYAAALRDGWVLLADGAAQSQLQRLAAAPPVRGSLGSLGGWMEGEEAYGALTPRGLWSVFHEIKQAASGATGGKASTARADTFVDKAEAELALVAFRGHLDENGNLSASIRARLNPNGDWMAMGRDLPLAGGFGIATLPKTAYALAAGGAIPRAWMEAISDAGMTGFRMSLSARGATDSDLADLDAARKREGAHVQGFSFLMPTLNPVNMRMQLQVDDSRAYEDDLKAEVAALLAACKPKRIPMPLHFESKEVDGRRLFGPVPEGSAEAGTDPGIQAAMARNQPRALFLARDGVTVEEVMGGADAAARLGAPLEGSLAEDDGLRRVAGLLPNEGTFFAFINFGGLFQQQAASMKEMDARLDKDLAQDLPPVPAAQDCPPLGLSLRFDLDHWDLSVGLAVETQLALGRTQESMAEAQQARMKAFSEQMKRHMPKRAPEAEPGEEAAPAAKDGD